MIGTVQLSLSAQFLRICGVQSGRNSLPCLPRLMRRFGGTFSQFTQVPGVRNCRKISDTSCLSISPILQEKNLAVGIALYAFASYACVFSPTILNYN